eukprot:UN17853
MIAMGNNQEESSSDFEGVLLNPSAKISMEKEVEKIRFSEIEGSPELIKILSDHLK